MRVAVFSGQSPQSQVSEALAASQYEVSQVVRLGSADCSVVVTPSRSQIPEDVRRSGKPYFVYIAEPC